MQFRYLHEDNLVLKCNLTFFSLLIQFCRCQSQSTLHSPSVLPVCCAIVLFSNDMISDTFPEEGELLLLRWVFVDPQALCVVLI